MENATAKKLMTYLGIAVSLWFFYKLLFPDPPNFTIRSIQNRFARGDTIQSIIRNDSSKAVYFIQRNHKIVPEVEYLQGKDWKPAPRQSFPVSEWLDTCYTLPPGDSLLISYKLLRSEFVGTGVYRFSYYLLRSPNDKLPTILEYSNQFEIHE